MPIDPGDEFIWRMLAILIGTRSIVGMIILSPLAIHWPILACLIGSYLIRLIFWDHILGIVLFIGILIKSAKPKAIGKSIPQEKHARDQSDHRSD